jgi:hypothetical protein
MILPWRSIAAAWIVFWGATATLASAALCMLVEAAETSGSDSRSVELRFLGGDKQVPLAGLEIQVTQGHGTTLQRGAISKNGCSASG